MRTLAKGDVPANLLSLGVELISVPEDAVVSVRRAEVDHHARARL
jgi:hypothetical protein